MWVWTISELIMYAIHFLLPGLSFLFCAPPTFLVKLYLPPTSTAYPSPELQHIPARSKPTPLPNVSFMANDDNRPRVFMITYCHNGPLDASDYRLTSVNLFVYQRMFTKYCEQQLALGGESLFPLRVPWEKWGLSNTRVMPHPSFVSRNGRDTHTASVLCIRRTPILHSMVILNLRRVIFLFKCCTSLWQPSSVRTSDMEDGPGTIMPPRTISTSDVPLLKDDAKTWLPFLKIGL